MTDESEGIRAARAQRRRLIWTFVLSILGAILAGGLLVAAKLAAGNVRGHTALGWAIPALLVFLAVLVFTIRAWDKATDELERLDNLRATSFGFYICLCTMFGWHVLWTTGSVPPPDVMSIFFLAGVATLGRYALLKIVR